MEDCQDPQNLDELIAILQDIRESFGNLGCCTFDFYKTDEEWWIELNLRFKEEPEKKLVFSEFKRID